MPSSLPRPPYDPELEPILRRFKFTPTVTTAHIEGVRKKSSPTVNDALAGREISHEERTILGSGGSSDLKVSIFRQASMTIRPASSARFENRPGILYTHGGGMIAGNRFLGIGVILDWVEEFDMVCVSIEYRIPPEHPDPTPIEDCYAGLKWTSMNAKSLGINPDCLMIAGSSAGGGLAAGTALLARDRGGPLLCAQVLICPMLDDRNVTVSSQQKMSAYTLPLREPLTSPNSPPAFIDVGTAEVFRDEAVAYATLLWKSGVQAELHVWSGGFHGFDLLAPNATLSINAREARSAWQPTMLITSWLSGAEQLYPIGLLIERG
ncbi:uncharacterized protein N7483_003439 [Penicillium malachiteum]|uniref:uncharacterized protein n=1 Tax=Penicillium malachiteum TaxID=1324776 RepID=UPI002547B7C5|nr:uncharacterized protein N7483_003439 [Penicillium malachiteum]KAJ5728931.1 hypothetical protein N7483_003439 [Penicillium malachiteum]